MTTTAHTCWSDECTFNSDIGLWRQTAPGHTSEVSRMAETHSGPDAASRLVARAATGDDAPFSQVLAALRGMQDLTSDSPTHGCFRWYHEETRITDSNAAFFICLNLLVLDLGYSAKLDEDCQKTLLSIFVALDGWFERCVPHEVVHYPNKFLGDLVCGWLVKERLGRQPDDSFRKAFQNAGRYWVGSPWGWGEHLSDPYADIMLNQLSCLLLMARLLPADLRALYTKLFRNLLSLDDAFAGGPRVPAIRSYAFQRIDHHASFRVQVRRPRDRTETVHNPGHTPHLRMFSFGEFFHRSGWHKLAGDPPKPSENLTIPCFGGATATAHLEATFRLGSMSRFPIMPHTDHATWGLSWQSMPVAFCGRNSDWSFLRWHTREDGIDRYHPARDKHQAYLHNALTDRVNPPLVGQTESVQHANRVVALRHLSTISRSWEVLSDGWDMVDFQGEVLSESLISNGWSRLCLRLKSGKEVALLHHPLRTNATPHSEWDEGRLSWRTTLGGESLGTLDSFAGLWLLGELADPDPEIEPLPDTRHFPFEEKRLLRWRPFPEAIGISFQRNGWTLCDAADDPCLEQSI